MIPFFFAIDLDAIPEPIYTRNPFAVVSEPIDDKDGVAHNSQNVAFESEELFTASPLEPLGESEPELSGQEKVLELSPDSSALVIAPPGTGKTHLLIDRVARLLNTDQFLNPADELLILSFSRAAVREVSNRLGARAQEGKSDAFDYVRVRTFDSFAGYMLTYEETASGSSGDYEASIRRLNEYIDNGRSEVINEKLNILRYLVVDEIQDLSKDRAELVLRLSRRVLANGGALLMLGDPCQAIYDWDIKEGELRSLEFLRQLRDVIESNEKGSVHSLDRYFRYANPATLAFVRSARKAMGEMGDAPSGTQLTTQLYNRGGLVELYDVESVLSKPGRTAILCRSNIDVHDAVTYLRARGHDVYSDEGTRSIGWPGWISMVLLGWESGTVSLERLEEGIADLFDDEEIAALDWSDMLATLDPRGFQNGYINVERVFSTVESSFPALTDRALAEISVSTVHKSKGLEYSNVLLLEPPIHTSGDPEEVRITYVAATRAKESFSLLRRDRKIFQGSSKGFRRDHVTRGHQFFFQGPEHYEVGSMLSEQVVARTSNWIEEFRRLQNRIWSEYQSKNAVFSGETVFIDGSRRIGVYLSKEAHGDQGVLIGFLSYEAQRSIHYKARQLGSDKVYLPSLPVVRLESFAFPDWSETAEKALGHAGLVVAPVIRGFAELIPV